MLADDTRNMLNVAISHLTAIADGSAAQHGAERMRAGIALDALRAIVDRPATTPTPAPGLDLDAVERAERAMTPGPWFVEKKPRFGGAISVLVDGLPRQVAEANGQALVVDEDPAARQIANAAGIVALRNAAPALIAEVRALRAAAEEREADMHMRIRAGYDKTVADAWRAEVAKRDAEIADLRALVESQRRDYLDVCDAIAPETSGPADAAAKVRALRAAFAEAKRLGLEACDRATHTEQCGKTQADYHHSKGYRGCPGEDEDCTCGLAAIAAALEAL